MRTRGPHPDEPRHSAPIYVRLGMTRGAFIAFCVIFALAVIGAWRLQTIANNAKHASERAQESAQEAKRATATLRNTTRLNRALIDQVRRIALDGAKARLALCEQVASTRAQIKASEDYLADVATGRRPPIQGVTTSDITSSLRRQKMFVESVLRHIDCDA